MRYGCYDGHTIALFADEVLGHAQGSLVYHDLITQNNLWEISIKQVKRQALSHWQVPLELLRAFLHAIKIAGHYWFARLL